ncbi:unnamed protein product [Absidia cylindrospora]
MALGWMASSSFNSRYQFHMGITSNSHPTIQQHQSRLSPGNADIFVVVQVLSAGLQNACKNEKYIEKQLCNWFPMISNAVLPTTYIQCTLRTTMEPLIHQEIQDYQDTFFVTIASSLPSFISTIILVRFSRNI